MDKILIEETKYTPEISFDPSHGALAIRGKSYPENPSQFYEPILDTLKDYLEEPDNDAMTITLELYFLNSSSTKILMDLCDILEDAVREGKGIHINWVYEENDDDSMELGEEFAETFRLIKFRLVERAV